MYGLPIMPSKRPISKGCFLEAYEAIQPEYQTKSFGFELLLKLYDQSCKTGRLQDARVGVLFRVECVLSCYGKCILSWFRMFVVRKCSSNLLTGLVFLVTTVSTVYVYG
jgi:hypothetical protein